MSDHIVFWLRHFAQPAVPYYEFDVVERYRATFTKGRRKMKARQRARKALRQT